MAKAKRRIEPPTTKAAPAAKQDVAKSSRFIGLTTMICAVLIVFYVGSQDAAKIKTTIFYIGTAALGAAWIIPALLKGELEYVKSHLTLPALAVTLLGLASLAVFPFRETIWSEVGRRMAYVLLYLVVIHTITTRRQLRRFGTAMIAVGAVVIVYGCIQHFGVDLPGLQWREQANVTLRIFSSLLNATYLAAYLAMLIPAAIAHFAVGGMTPPQPSPKGEGASSPSFRRGLGGGPFFRRFDIGKILSGFVIGGGQIALIWTWTRGAWIGLAAGLIFSLVVALAALKKLDSREARDARKWLAVAAAVLVLGSVIGSVTQKDVLGRAGSVITSVIGSKPSVEAATKAGKGEDLSNLQRVTQWRAAWTLFEKHPIFGVGVGATTTHIPPYLTPAFFATSRDVVSGHPHNEFIEILSESGVIGGIVFLWLFAAIFAVGLGTVFRAAKTRDIETTLVATALLGGILAFLVANIGGLTMRCTFGGMLFWLAIGLVVVCRRLHADENSETKQVIAKLRLPFSWITREVLAVVVLAVVAVVAYYSISLLISDIYLHRTEQGLVAKDWPKAIRNGRASIRYNKQNVLAHYKLANALFADGNYKASLVECKAVMRFAPDYARLHNYTASLYLKLGPKYYDEAMAEVRRQITIDGLPGSYAQLSRIQEAMGQSRAALASLQRALRLLKSAPDGDLRLWKVESPRLVDLQAEVFPQEDIMRAIEPYIPNNANAFGPRSALGMHLVDMRDYARAEKQLKLAIEADPHNIPTLDRYGYVLFQTGKYAESIKVYEDLAAECEMNPDLKDIYLMCLMNVAASYGKIGDLSSARATWNKVVQAAPESRTAQRARTMLRFQ